MDENRRIQYVASGEQILFRPAARWAYTIARLIWVILVGVLAYWSGPAVIAFFERGEMTGAARYLERFHFSSGGMFAAMLAWAGFLAWTGLGGLYEIFRLHRQQDRFLLRADSLIVQRRRIWTKEIHLPVYEPLALRLRSLDGALEAKSKSGFHVLTDGGTKEDRLWLLQLLQQRYNAPVDLPATTKITRERVATYIVEKRPDGTTRITSSGLSTVGCAVMGGVLSVLLLTSTIWLFGAGSGAGIVTLMFALGIGLAALGFFKRRMVEASRGRLRVEWNNPATPYIQRIPILNLILGATGQGSFQAKTGSLRIRQASQSSCAIVLVRSFSEDNAQPIGPGRLCEEMVLDIHGHGSEDTADYLLRVLVEATGFPASGNQASA
jgi:hypothetical protein